MSSKLDAEQELQRRWSASFVAASLAGLAKQGARTACALPYRHGTAIALVPDMKLLSYNDLGFRLSLSRATLERMVTRAQLPAPVQVSSGAVRFIEDEITEWLATRPRTKTTTNERKLNEPTVHSVHDQ